MKTILRLVAAALVLGGCGYFWVSQYVIPKQNVLMAAQVCHGKAGFARMDSEASKSAWIKCMTQAESKHGTKTLDLVGY